MAYNLTKAVAGFLLVAVIWLPASAAEFERYTNARFGVTGLVPKGYIAQTESENGDGKAFTSPDGEVSLLIYGSYDALGGIAEYRKFLIDNFSANGDITYKPVKKNWFVLSGYQGDNIFYLRVERAKGCDGADVYAHMVVEYPIAVRANVDPLLGALGKGLDMAPC